MTLTDRFGEYGLISLVILKKQGTELFIDTWLMSCRVLRRGVESCLFNEIVKIAQDGGFSKLRAEYLPTAKNAMVADFYDKMGMRALGDGQYELDPAQYVPQEHLIGI